MFYYFHCLVVIIICFLLFCWIAFFPAWVANRSVWAATRQTERVADPMDSTVGSPTQPLTNHSQITRKPLTRHAQTTHTTTRKNYLTTHTTTRNAKKWQHSRKNDHSHKPLTHQQNHSHKPLTRISQTTHTTLANHSHDHSQKNLKPLTPYSTTTHTTTRIIYGSRVIGLREWFVRVVRASGSCEWLLKKAMKKQRKPRENSWIIHQNSKENLEENLRKPIRNTIDKDFPLF